jgi:hypothetical protein
MLHWTMQVGAKKTDFEIAIRFFGNNPKRRKIILLKSFVYSKRRERKR